MTKIYIYSAEYRQQKNKEYYQKHKNEILAKRKTHKFTNTNNNKLQPKYIHIVQK